MDSVVARLEAVAARLESLGVSGGAATGTSSASAPVASESLDAFQAIVDGALKTFLDLSAKIGGEVKEQVGAGSHKRRIRQVAEEPCAPFLESFKVAPARSKAPDQATLGELIKPLSTHINAVVEFREKNRKVGAVANHLAALAEGVPALGWVIVAPKPAPHVVQAKDAAEFYTNRVLKEFKDKDETQKNWARAFPALLNELHDFVKKFHTTGLVWNPKGTDAKAAAASAPESTQPKASAPATPAPTPAVSASPAAQTSNVALFSSLQQGEGITSGLKKVDKSQMTHKNPALRAAGVVQKKVGQQSLGWVDERREYHHRQTKEVTATDLENSKATVGAKAAAAAPPKTELSGSKWTVEHHKDNKNIVLEETENKHVVYIYRCVNSVIVVKGKVNQVTLDNCKKVGVVVESVISGVDVVNSQSCQVQITGKAPTVTVDKTDGLQIYLSKDSIEAEILSAKSSELNVVVPGKTEDDDPVETSIPEQLKTQWNGKKLVTSILEHKA